MKNDEKIYQNALTNRKIYNNMAKIISKNREKLLINERKFHKGVEHWENCLKMAKKKSWKIVEKWPKNLQKILLKHGKIAKKLWKMWIFNRDFIKKNWEKLLENDQEINKEIVETPKNCPKIT